MLEISRCFPSAKGIFFIRCWRLYSPISITPLGSKVFKKIVAGKLSNFLERNSLLLPSKFLYRRGLGTCDALLTLSHHLQVALARGMEGRLVRLDFPAVQLCNNNTYINRVSHRCLLSLGIWGQFLSIVSELLGDRRQRVSLDGKVSASVNVVSEIPYSVDFSAVIVYIILLRALPQCWQLFCGLRE